MKSIFETEQYKKYERMWNARVSTLQKRKSYYDGTIYKGLTSMIGQIGPRVVGEIKPLYMPLARAVDVDAGIIPGRWELEDGVPERLRTARDMVFDWSRWKTGGVLFVHYGASYGVTGLRIADLRMEKKVVVQPVQPINFLLVRENEYSDDPTQAIWVETQTDETGKNYEYAEVITPDEIRTYLDGEPHGFGERPESYANELGFVPYVEVIHLETGEALGECTYQKATAMLDEANQLATDLANVIKKHAEPQWAVSGAEPSELKHSGDVMWFLPSGSEAQALVPKIDVEGVLKFVQEIKGSVKESLPELAFDELKNKDNIASATIELQLLELVLKIKRIRPNYDEGLETALRMAGRAAATMGLREVAVLDSKDLQIDSERQVLPIDRLTEIRLEMEEIALEQEKALARVRKPSTPEDKTA